MIGIKMLKRTSVHITLRAIPCTATVDPRNKMRLGVEPLPLCKVRARKVQGLI